MTSLADEMAIRALAYRYAEAIDTNRGDLLAELFTADGAIEAPNGRFAGHEALRQLPVAMQQRYRKTFHAVLNQTTAIDGDQASATTYCIARHLLPAPAENALCYEMTLRYADRLMRDAQGWRFVHRLLMVDWTHVYQVNPGEKLW
jgi:hypothetical protein